jgi:hypothetical protein
MSQRTHFVRFFAPMGAPSRPAACRGEKGSDLDVSRSEGSGDYVPSKWGVPHTPIGAHM